MKFDLGGAEDYLGRVQNNADFAAQNPEGDLEEMFDEDPTPEELLHKDENDGESDHIDYPDGQGQQ